MRVLIADKMDETVIAAIGALGHQVAYSPSLTADDLSSHLSEIQILVVRSTRVSKETLLSAPSLSLVVRAGAGVNTIDVAAAAARGIYVSNCPGRNKDAVAELAIGLLVACDRRIVDACADLRAGRWRKKQYSAARGLNGRTLGILGMGLIGRAVARCAQGLGMVVVAWSRSLTPDMAAELGVGWCASPEEVARKSDAVTVHLAAKPQTHHLVDAAFLAELKTGAILINTSRGTLVDTAALKEAIATRGLRVGMDVFEGEPAGGDAVFADVELAAAVTCTPHIAASTAQASEAVAAEVARIVEVFSSNGKPPNAVNVTRRTPATHSLVVRHLNQVGVLAHVLASLRAQGINVEEMENTIFDGGLAACATLHLGQAPSETTLEEILSAESVLQVTIEARPSEE